jgi:hypothetical protein
VRQAIPIFVLLFLLGAPWTAPAAAEVAPFKLTDFWAYLELKYRLDQIDNRSTGVETDIEDTRRQVELGLSTTSYVFHPKLLQMRVAGSLLSNHQSIIRNQSSLPLGNTSTSSNKTDELFLNMDAVFQFLKDKRYPTTISYMRDNPIVSTGLEGSFTQETERFGVDFLLRDTLPVDLSLNAFKDSSFGESLDRVVDFSTERLTLKAKKSFSPGNRMSLDLETSNQASRNGDPRRPIQEVVRHADRVSFSSTSRLGSGDRLRIDQSATFNRRDEPDVTDINYAPRIRWKHNATWESRYQYRFSQSDRPETDYKNRTEAFAASIHYSPSRSFNSSIRSDFDRSDELDRLQQTGKGISGTANLLRDFGFGQLNLAMGLGYRLDDRVSESPRIVVEEEPVTFVGTTPIPLSRDFVVAETVIVRNETGTQTYIEGVDYLLSELGSTTRIERNISGSILDGETVLVDYQAETGGTFAFSETDQSFNANFRFARFHSIFFRYLNNRQDLQSGFSTLPLNSVEAIEFGIREQIPLSWGGIELFGEAKHRQQDEDINPFDQTSLTFSIQAPLPQRLTLNASASRNIVNSDFSNEDSDMVTFNANLSWQALGNLSVWLDGTYDEDTGGTVIRTNERWKLGAQWRYRKISLRLDTRYLRQQQGSLDNNHYEFWLQIRRELF